VIPAAFDYVRAHSVDEALHLLAAHGDDAKLLAGGMSLIPMMKLRFAAPSTLIDIRTIPALRTIDVAPERITIGALTTHAALAADERLRVAAPALWDAANVLGDPQVRNLGTLGGSASHADPAADYPAVLLALDAQFTLAGRQGERRVAAAAFFRGIFETALAPGELLTHISFAPAPASAYEKFHHPASHYAVAGAAAVLTVADGRVATARVAITGVADVAFRAAAAEGALTGVPITDRAAIEAATAGAASGADAREDAFASGPYRQAMAGVFAARAVQRAAAR